MAKTTTTALTKYDAKLAEIAARATKTVAKVGGGGNFLSLKSGILSYQKAAVEGNRMRVVIVDYVLENQYYSKPFVEGSPAAPDCYAFGTNPDTMIPHEAIAQPVSPACKGCPLKEFGSKEQGKGKACGDVIRMALITEDGLEDIENAEIAYLKLPYFSTIEWKNYWTAQEAAYPGVPPFLFVTEISVAPDAKSQFKVRFRMEDFIDPKKKENAEVVEALINKQEEVEKTIGFPYPEIETATALTPRARATTPRAATAAPRGRAAVAAAAAKPRAVRTNGAATPTAPAIALPASSRGAATPLRIGARKAARAEKF